MNRGLFSLGLSGLALVVAQVASNAGCAGGTGSARFEFDARISGPADAPSTGGPLVFTNEKGFAVTLTRATVTLGPVYLNVIAPLRGDTLGFSDLFEGTAFAAGEDHLGEGRVVGEVLGQVTFDALSSRWVSFPVRGTIVDETVRTTDLWFYPEPGVSPDTTKIDTVALDVAGSAEKDGVRVPFRGKLVLDDAWLPDATSGQRAKQSIAQIRKVRGISSAFRPTEGGSLEIRFDVRRPFRGADFSNLAANPTDKDGTKVLVQAKTGKVTTDQVMTNLYQGLRDATGTYSIAWRPR